MVDRIFDEINILTAYVCCAVHWKPVWLPELLANRREVKINLGEGTRTLPL